jgi:hypothetical protein
MRPAPASWTLLMAKHLRSRAPRHLIMDGSFARNDDPESCYHREVLESPDVDILSCARLLSYSPELKLMLLLSQTTTTETEMSGGSRRTARSRRGITRCSSSPSLLHRFSTAELYRDLHHHTLLYLTVLTITFYTASSPASSASSRRRSCTRPSLLPSTPLAELARLSGPYVLTRHAEVSRRIAKMGATGLTVRLSSSRTSFPLSLATLLQQPRWRLSSLVGVLDSTC